MVRRVMPPPKLTASVLCLIRSDRHREPASFRTDVNDVVTLLGKSHTCGPAVLHMISGGQRDRRYSPGEAHSHGVGNGPLRLTQRSLS
jgi:hypothetical protein